jgi:hypothetical protein
MKFFAYLLCFYLTILTALPSVRVMKMEFFEKNQSSCKTNNDSQSSCERGNVIMNLNFSPSQCINAQFIPFILVIPLFEPIKKEKSNYEKIFISQYISSIWQPPKFISLV